MWGVRILAGGGEKETRQEKGPGVYLEALGAVAQKQPGESRMRKCQEDFGFWWQGEDSEGHVDLWKLGNIFFYFHRRDMEDELEV